MKVFKKIAGLLLAGTLVLGMSANVMAADITIENTETDHTYTVYQIFTGTLDSDGKTLTDIVWGDGVTAAGQTYFEGTVTPDVGETEVQAYAKSLVNGGTAAAEEMADIMVGKGYLDSTNGTEVSYAGGGYTVSGLANGYYLITDTSASGAVSTYLVSVAGDVTLKPKTGVPTFEKKVQDTNDTDNTTTEWQDSADYDIGDKVPFQLKATLPASGYEDFENYYLSFEDDLCDGLVLDKDSIKVYHVSATTAVETEIADYTISYSTADEDDFKLSIVNLKDEVAAESGDSIVVTYNATLEGDDVEIGAVGNTNTASLTYQRNASYTGSVIPGEYGEDDEMDTDGDGIPDDEDTDNDNDGTPDATDPDDDNDGILDGEDTDADGDGIPDDEETDTDSDGTPDSEDTDDDGDGTPDEDETDDDKTNDAVGETAEDKVIVFTYELVVNKVDESDAPLAGAEFTLYKKDADATGAIPTVAGYDEYHKVKTINGVTTFEFEGLDDGEYLLVETVTPAGYNTADPITFEITATHDVNSDDPQLLTLTVDNGDFTAVKDTGIITTDVVNLEGTQLPSTGSIGTTIFYLVGGALVVVAGVLLVTKRRMRNK